MGLQKNSILRVTTLAKLNWLVQWRSLHHKYCGQPVWVDMVGGPGKDTYGNAGFQVKAEAKSQLSELRVLHPSCDYRLIRIAE